MTDESREKPRVYKANYMLQQKVGAGPLDQAVVERMQQTIDTNDFDFTAIGMQFLKELQAALAIARDPAVDMATKKQKLTEPVMQLKANGAIFHYSLIGSLANVMLSFLEAIKDLDKDALDIVQAHHTTLQAIIVKKMRGDGGEVGATMIKELKEACGRYYRKKKGQK